jgi:arabinan endo-1,5-alpha-L-arabinosidase
LRRWVALAFAATLAFAGAPPFPAQPSDAPAAIERDFPDPDLILAGDGLFYAYASGHRDQDGLLRLSLSRSRDLRSWTEPFDPLAGAPGWARPGAVGWAPHVVARDGRYLLFYAIAEGPEGTDRYGIGVASAADPAGPFRGEGRLDTGDADVNIDPMVFEDPASGRAYLYWGRNGVIAARELTADLHGFAPGSEVADVLAPMPGRPFESVVEAPFVVASKGFYYLFYSGDDCCERPHHAVMVARSRAPLGPFERLGDMPGREGDGRVLEASGRWQAPGHCSVLRDAGGRWWIAYHAIDAKRPSGRDGSLRRVMKLDPIDFTGDWPVVGAAR